MSAAAQLQGPPAPRFAPGTLVITPSMAFNLAKAGVDVAKFGAYHASQDTRFRDFTTGGFATSSRPEEFYFPKYDRAKTLARGRVMFRNQPHLAAMLKAFVMEIGTPTLKSQTGIADYDDAKEWLFEEWSESCEAEHNLSLDQVVEIYGYEEAIAGEMFGVKRKEGTVQLVASELCGSPGTNRRQTLQVAGGKPAKFADGTPVPAGATECDGIVRAAGPLGPDGKATPGPIIGYRFGTRDENGAISFDSERSTIVQAQYVLHLFDPDRAEMGRGIPLLVPILNAMQDVFETAHARAQQVKNAACLSLWITKEIDPYGFAETMRGGLAAGALENVESLKQMAAQRSGYQEIKAGAVYYGGVNEKLQLIEPKLNAGDFHDHYIDLLQVCCACLNGMPVEIAMEGFRASSYSSARATVNKWKRNVRRMRTRREKSLLNPLQLWQSRRFQLFGDLQTPPAAKAGTLSYSADRNIRWGWPAIPDIDEAKTAATNALELANGTTSLERIYADRGEYADVEMAIIAREKARFVKLLMDEAKKIGMSDSEAKSWALAQTSGGEGVAALLGPVVQTALAPELAAAQPAKK